VELIKDRTFKGDTLQIDNRIFIDCLLINCTLEYEGGAVSFKRTQMRGCQYVFFGRAKRTFFTPSSRRIERQEEAEHRSMMLLCLTTSKAKFSLMLLNDLAAYP